MVGANLPYDIDHLLEEGVDFEPEFFRDVQVADPLIDELHDSYSLESIAERHGLPGKDESLLAQAAECYGKDKLLYQDEIPQAFTKSMPMIDSNLLQVKDYSAGAEPTADKRRLRFTNTDRIVIFVGRPFWENDFSNRSMTPCR